MGPAINAEVQEYRCLILDSAAGSAEEEGEEEEGDDGDQDAAAGAIEDVHGVISSGAGLAVKPLQTLPGKVISLVARPSGRQKAHHAPLQCAMARLEIERTEPGAPARRPDDVAHRHDRALRLILGRE